MRRYRFVLIALAGFVLATAAPANACSCAITDDRDRLERADAAIIGTALARAQTQDEWTVVYTFRVDEEVKGEFDETVEISTASNGAACGLEVEIGQKTGLFLSGNHAEGWSSSLCQQISPQRLRDAAQPMPAPDGEGPIKLIAAGNWGEMGLFALDSEGRTLMYGERPGGTTVMDVCPGSTLFIEDPWGGKRRWVVRRTADFEVVDVVTPPRGAFPYQCLAADASEVLVYSIRYGEPLSNSKLYRYEDGNFELLYEGTSSWFTVVDDRVYLTEGRYGRNVRVLDLETGTKGFIARVPRYAQGVAVSPNEMLLATTGGRGERELLSVVDRSGPAPTVVTKDHGAGMSGEPYWLDDERFVYFPGGYDNNKVKIFDKNLNSEVLPGSWYSLTEELNGDVAYGAGWGTLFRVRLPDGPAEVLREFPSPEIHSVVVVPDEIDPAP